MGNLKQLRDRVKSIKSTAKLTKAMKMVAASRLTKTKKDLISSELYVNSINSIISNLNFEEIIENSEYILIQLKNIFYLFQK